MEISQCKIINDFYILFLQGKFSYWIEILPEPINLLLYWQYNALTKLEISLIHIHPKWLFWYLVIWISMNITSSSRIYQSQGLWLDSMGYSYLQLKFALLCLKIIKLYIECFPRQILSCSSIGDFLHQP